MSATDLVFCNGKRGKSKAQVRLSANTVFQSLALHVWEKGKITHSFYPNAAFLSALIAHAQQALATIEGNGGKPLVELL